MKFVIHSTDEPGIQLMKSRAVESNQNFQLMKQRAVESDQSLSLTNHMDRITLKQTWKPNQENKEEAETYLSHAVQSGSNQDDGQR